MDRSTNHSVLLIWSVLVMIFLVGCETTKIGDINRDPGRYAGKDITISGQATESFGVRSEEHTSELQSLAYLVCRLLLEKKKKKKHEATADTSTTTDRHPHHCMDL